MDQNNKSVITCDLDGKVETFSEGAEQLFGYASKDVIGKLRVSDFSDGQVVLGHVVKWLKIAVEKGEWSGDTVFLDKAKKEIPCHIKITPTKDKNGEHIGYCGVTTPLTNKTPEEVRPKINLMTKVFTWMVIMRLPFLTATFVPLFTGAAVANMLGFTVSWGWLGLTILGGSLLHIGTNTANDYYDHTSGTDEANVNYMVPFSGGSRSIQMGLISAKGMLTVAIVSFGLSALVGIPLIQKAGMPVFWLGLIGFFSGLFYTAPPFRFASRKGLGELIIGLNFGPLMVAGSTLVQTGKLLPEAFLAGIPIGLLVAAIVYVNEFPDYHGDKATGKDTLIVVFGPKKARLGYVLLVVSAFLSIALMATIGTFPMLSLIALSASFLVINIVKVLYKNYDNRLLQPANAGTINLHAITGVLFCIGIWFGSV
jgi:1,4-dihydroxy-2-naphthoate octaprenyltransferase